MLSRRHMHRSQKKLENSLSAGTTTCAHEKERRSFVKQRGWVGMGWEGNTNGETLLDAGVVEPVLAGGALDHLGVVDGVVGAVAPAEAPGKVVVVVVARVARAARRVVRVKLARTARGRRAAVAAEAVLVVQLDRVVLEVAPQVARKAHAHHVPRLLRARPARVHRLREVPL